MDKESIENYIPLEQTNYGGLRKFIQFYKKSFVRIPEVLLKAAVKLIQNFKGRLGDECKNSFILSILKRFSRFHCIGGYIPCFNRMPTIRNC